MTTVLWDLDEAGRLVLEPEDRMRQTMRTLATLRQASTVAELRRAELPSWAEQVVESRVELLKDEGVDAVDATAWRRSEVSELVVDTVPLPWDARSLTQWLDEGLLHEHATVGGASPGATVTPTGSTTRRNYWPTSSARATSSSADLVWPKSTSVPCDQPMRGVVCTTAVGASSAAKEDSVASSASGGVSSLSRYRHGSIRLRCCHQAGHAERGRGEPLASGKVVADTVGGSGPSGDAWDPSQISPARSRRHG